MKNIANRWILLAFLMLIAMSLELLWLGYVQIKRNEPAGFVLLSIAVIIANYALVGFPIDAKRYRSFGKQKNETEDQEGQRGHESRFKN
jgi:hypothetical protein